MKSPSKPQTTPDLTTAEAARILRLHVNSVRMLIHAGHLPAYQVGEGQVGRYRIRVVDLDAFRTPRRPAH